MKNASLALLGVIVLFPASAAYAVELSGTLQGATETSVKVLPVDADANVEVESSVDVTTKSDATSEKGEEGTTSSNTEVRTTSSGSLKVTRADVEGGAVTASNISTNAVSSETDLSGFVAAQITADEHLAQVDSSAEHVSVVYVQIGRLFGLVPVSVDVETIVRADGSVDVRYPWYAFLMTTNKADLEPSIENRVSSITSSSGATAEFTARQKAAVISEVRSVLEGKLSAEMAASGSANANVE